MSYEKDVDFFKKIVEKNFKDKTFEKYIDSGLASDFIHNLVEMLGGSGLGRPHKVQWFSHDSGKWHDDGPWRHARSGRRGEADHVRRRYRRVRLDRGER